MTGVAELWVIASVIADVGFRLCTKLYDSAGTIASADKAISPQSPRMST